MRALRADEIWWIEFRAAVADLRLYLAKRRCERSIDEFFRKYREDQPRAPRGTPEGGQWIDDLGGARPGVAVVDSRVRVAQIDDPVDRYSVNLQSEEFKGPTGNTGHAIRRHVGKSPRELMELLAATRQFEAQTPAERRYRAQQLWGSFISIEEANDLVSQTLLANRSRVDRVISGLSRQEAITYDFGYPTGIEAYWVGVDPPTAIRSTFSVTVLIRSDPYSLRRYRVHTAYPMNRDPRIEIVQ